MTDTIVQAGAESTPAPQGTSVSAGEPVQGTSADTESQNVQEVQTGGEPSREGLPDGFDSLENAAKMYKDIQKLVSTKDNQYSEIKSQLAALDRFGGFDKVVQWADTLSASPEFNQWVQDKNKQTYYGYDPNTMDAESKQAIELIEKVSTFKAQELINQIVDKQVTPIVEANRKATIQTHFAALEQKYPKWRDVADNMDKLSEQLPANISDNPSAKDIEALYLMAIVDAGKVEDFAASIYSKKLETKKSQTSAQPPTNTGNANPKSAKTVREAFEMAKRALNG